MGSYRYDESHIRKWDSSFVFSRIKSPRSAIGPTISCTTPLQQCRVSGRPVPSFASSIKSRPELPRFKPKRTEHQDRGFDISLPLPLPHRTSPPLRRRLLPQLPSVTAAQHMRELASKMPAAQLRSAVLPSRLARHVKVARAFSTGAALQREIRDAYILSASRTPTAKVREARPLSRPLTADRPPPVQRLVPDGARPQAWRRRHQVGR